MKKAVDQKWDNATKAARGKITPNLSPDDSLKASQAVLNLAQAKALYTSLEFSKELNGELEILLDRVRTNLHPADMMKATQAVLNLTHVKTHYGSKPGDKEEKATETG